jgi:drug/metabolite transporter superfamily protein YnfA
MNVLAWFTFLAAALLEVVGDATARRGLRSGSILFVLTGCGMLACYGLVVNSVKWDFSRLLGVYVGFFALVSVLFGGMVLRERIPPSTWLGLSLIMTGCMIIQFAR